MTLLKIENLTHCFGGLCAVSDFNLNLNADELVGIIGPNGAGKTTVFNLISGIYRASSGHISLNQHELIGLSSSKINRLGIARTFQNIRLFKELTVLDNVRIAWFQNTKTNPFSALFQTPAHTREEKRLFSASMDLLALFKLDQYADELAKSLPYGMQRRLEIARALASSPKILLLDEPAAGLNPNEINNLMEFILWIRKEFRLTILLIEHQMKLVMGICQRLLVLDFGVTIAQGSPQEIQNNPKVLEAYLGEE